MRAAYHEIRISSIVLKQWEAGILPTNTEPCCIFIILVQFLSFGIRNCRWLKDSSNLLGYDMTDTVLPKRSLLLRPWRSLPCLFMRYRAWPFAILLVRCFFFPTRTAERTFTYITIEALRPIRIARITLGMSIFLGHCISRWFLGPTFPEE